jgi:hypothetical protein
VKRPRNSVHWKAVARAAEKLAADRLRDLEAERDRIDTLSTALGDALEEKGKIEVSAWLWERAAIIEGILLLAALGWMVWR